MHVGLITYQSGHRKTMDLTLKLLSKKYTVTLFAFPFSPRLPKPDAPYQDRPSQILRYDVREFAAQCGANYVEVDGWGPEHSGKLDTHNPDIWLTCIAKIIPASFIASRIILNCHPGMLPKNRGVDAFKWSVMKGWPVGVTLHAIDAEIDRGTILYRRVVPILSNDTLEDVCQRAYDFEVDVLANFDAHLHNLKHGWMVGDEYPVSHKHITRAMDDNLPELFAENRVTLMAGGRREPQQTYP